MGKEKSLERCYNCGCDFTSENISTREHIPMKCLYKGITKQENILRFLHVDIVMRIILILITK